MKIFCVGLSRTGARSLTAALRQLGYDARHFKYTRQALRLEPDGTLGLDLAYFQEPDTLLTIDVLGGEGWAQLCPFLGKPVLRRPFPRRPRPLKGRFRRLRKRVGNPLGRS